MSTLDWIVERELTSGGLEAIEGCGKPYPEVSGYCIPTLIDNKCEDLAIRVANWLVSKQRRDGSWKGMDNTYYVFDTGAIIEGLRSAELLTKDIKYFQAIARAKRWIESMKNDKGFYKTSDGDDRTAFYLGRVAWIMNDYCAMTYHIPTTAFPATWGEKPRVHYIAYLLEGLWGIGYKQPVLEILETAKRCVRPGQLFPSRVSWMWQSEGFSDTCATIQMAILYHKTGDKKFTEELFGAIEKMIMPDGGLRLSNECEDKPLWTAKFYLDLVREMYG